MARIDALARHPQPITLASGAIDLSLIVAKVVVGLLTGSLALLSDAVHSGLDLMASIMAFIAIRAAERPADLDHPYGHGRAENLAAYTEGILVEEPCLHRQATSSLEPASATVGLPTTWPSQCAELVSRRRTGDLDSASRSQPLDQLARRLLA
jgi:Cation efflux family